MNKAEFRKMVTDWHYSQFEEFSMEPNEIDESHPYDADPEGFALVLEGEITLEKESGNQTCRVGNNVKCIAPGSLDTSLSHAAGLSDIAVCHA